MEKFELSTIIDTLVHQLKGATQESHFFFWRYLDMCCDSKSEFYILGDLQKLAEILKERNLHSLIDAFSLYDYRAALQLDYLVLED